MQWYNEEEDILNIELDKGDYWKSLELPNGIVLDIGKDGKLKGIEILKASKVFSGDAQKVLQRVSGD